MALKREAAAFAREERRARLESSRQDALRLAKTVSSATRHRRQLTALEREVRLTAEGALIERTADVQDTLSDHGEAIATALDKVAQLEEARRQAEQLVQAKERAYSHAIRSVNSTHPGLLPLCRPRDIELEYNPPPRAIEL